MKNDVYFSFYQGRKVLFGYKYLDSYTQIGGVSGVVG